LAWHGCRRGCAGSIPDRAAAAPTTAGPTASDLLAALRRGVAKGEVELRVEPKRLTHIDSPVAVEADGNIWAYAALLIAALLWWGWGVTAGMAALVLGVAAYATLGRAYIHRRIERRVRREALDDIDKWRRLWRFGGLTLTAVERRDLAPCASPDGNWMAFARALTRAVGGAA
jgi:hypothetical protein